MSAKLIILAFAAVACQVNGQFGYQFPFGNNNFQGFPSRPSVFSNIFSLISGQRPTQQYPSILDFFNGQNPWQQRPQLVPPHNRPTYRPQVFPFYSSEEQDQGSFVGQPGTFDIQPDYVQPGTFDIQPDYVQPGTFDIQPDYVQPGTFDIQPDYVQPDVFDTVDNNVFYPGNSLEESQEPSEEVTSEEYYPENPEVIQSNFVPDGVQISPPHPGHEQLEEFPEDFPETHQVVQPIYIPSTDDEEEEEEEDIDLDNEDEDEDIDIDDDHESPEIGLQVEDESEERAPIETDVPEKEVEHEEAGLSVDPLFQAAPLV